MAYPTTLALITALWSGQPRTRSIALWSAIGGAISALGPLIAGALLEHFWWGSVFLVTLAARRGRAGARARARARPRQRDDRPGRQPRRHPLGGRGRRTHPRHQLRAGPRQGSGRDRARRRSRSRQDRRLRDPPDAGPASRSTTSTSQRGGSSGWPPCAGIIVFGSLMGAMFIGQQFLQNVLGYSTLDAGASHPARRGLHGDRRAALGQARRGQGRALHLARSGTCSASSASSRCCCCGRRASRTGRSGSPTRSSASASGFAGTPASHSLTGSVPVRPRRHGLGHRRPAARPRRGDHAVDPRRAAHRGVRRRDGRGDRQFSERRTGHARRPRPSSRSRSRSAARHRAAVPASTRTQIIAAAKTSFLDGANWAYAAGIIAILAGAALVFFMFPKHDRERAAARGVPRGGRHAGRRRELSVVA